MSKRKSIFSRMDITQSPKRILIMRFHAIGDVAITLPSCAALRIFLPDATIDYLTSNVAAPIPNATRIFTHVLIFKWNNSGAIRFIQMLFWAFRIRTSCYDVIIDLQRNWMSRLIRRIAHPEAWSEFNRTSHMPAGDRVLVCFQKIGYKKMNPKYELNIHDELISRAQKILLNSGWISNKKLIVLNPAGLTITRNWEIDKYVEIAKMFIEKCNAQILLIGTERIQEKARHISEHCNPSVINLVCKTTLEEAFACIQYANLIVSEDSGLMHIAWVSGIPTVALFGSGPYYWAQPSNKNSVTFHSGDLECGACMKDECRYDDVHCLRRITPEAVFHAALKLLKQKHDHEIVS